MIQFLNVILIIFLILCALAAASSRTLITAVILFAAYSAVMSVLWLLLLAPDVAMTEAAIGVGVNTVMFTAVISCLREDRA